MSPRGHHREVDARLAFLREPLARNGRPGCSASRR
jgi:hypothetical protein